MADYVAVPWTQAEDDALIAAYNAGQRMADISAALGRSKKSIEGRIVRMRIRGMPIAERYVSDGRRKLWFAAVLAKVTELAVAGLVCPTKAQLAELLCINRSNISAILGKLHDDGVIRLVQYPAGPMITIVATGNTTAKPLDHRPKPPPRGKAQKPAFRRKFAMAPPPVGPTIPAYLEAAVTALRRRGAVVYAERVDNNKVDLTGLWVINRDLVPPAELLARAAALGAPR
jgi:hypothetical protein